MGRKKRRRGKSMPAFSSLLTDGSRSSYVFGVPVAFLEQSFDLAERVLTVP